VTSAPLPTIEPCSDEGLEHHAHQPRSDGTIRAAAVLFSALGDPSRLRIMELLYDGAHCVGDLAGELNEGMSSVSQRLKQLNLARLVSRERVGKHIYYRLADDHVRELLESVFEHVDEDH
jgi:ArsR family transcriptional regulator, lead/cadmium/zinc/bismuth-responsive transcriptional repressor